MSLRLYLDENITPVLAQQLRRRGFDVVSASEVGMLAKTDEEQLEYASNNGRVLLTFDTDFIPIVVRWLSNGRHHNGIVISKEVKRDQTGELVKLCSMFLSQVRNDEATDAIFFLQQFKRVI
ncbi:MAG: hypothetical protein HW384_1155 [Dehalococcoidia bacterium]|nr:hypothetical protein [Dehalococcoidia bacterium]